MTTISRVFFLLSVNTESVVHLLHKVCIKIKVTFYANGNQRVLHTAVCTRVFLRVVSARDAKHTEHNHYVVVVYFGLCVDKCAASCTIIQKNKWKVLM